MPDWLSAYLGMLQGGIIRSLAAEIRAGGLFSAALAFALGSLHALTPGHGKAALATYFLGKAAPVGKGLRVTMLAAMLHVLSGLAAFLVLRFILQQVPSISGRGSPLFTALGYGFIVLAGAMMVYQALRPARVQHDGAHALTAGIGLLPCPLTISVLGFAWTQADALMIAVVLFSLALGIAFTIGTVALLAIAARSLFGNAAADWLPGLERAARHVQVIAGCAIVAIGLWFCLRLLR